MMDARLDIIAEILLAVAFLATALVVGSVALRQQEIDIRVKSGLFIFSASIILLAAINFSYSVANDPAGTSLQPVVKILAGFLIIFALVISSPMLRLVFRNTTLLASLSRTHNLLHERKYLELSKSELEKEVILSAYRLERVNKQMELAIDGSPITLFRQDLNHRYIWIFNPPPRTKPDDYIGRSDMELFPRHTALAITETKQRAVSTGEEQTMEVQTKLPNGLSWHMVRVQPDYNERGKIIGTVSCAVDITEQKKQQQRQHLLMREVTHRSKNLLAVLQSVVRQTANRTGDINQFMNQLTARLRSMAESHDLLVNDEWQGTSLEALIRSQLTVFSALDGDRIEIKGRPCLLTAAAVQNIGLVIHELATNAMKYGALSNEHGHILIGWNLKRAQRPNGHDNDEGMLEITWSEAGGPTVVEPDQKGFGRMLVERVAGQALGGKVTLSFPPTGVVCDMQFPCARVIAGEDALA